MDTVPPTIEKYTDGCQIYFGNESTQTFTDDRKPEDKWYTQAELSGKGFSRLCASMCGAGRDEDNNMIDSTGLNGWRWLVNGKEVKGGESTPWNTEKVDAIDIQSLTGVNDITLEVTDYAGNTATASMTLKLKEGKERTPEAALDYPADAFTQLAKNADYAVTVGGVTYTVNSGVLGRIPFVLTHGVTADIAVGREIDLCGKEIRIVKKGVTENGEQCTTDSDSQSLSVNARPAALNESKIAFEAELLEDAEDAEINLTIEADDYTYEYSADAGRTWREVPSDNKVKNLPKGDILLRVEAKANTAGANDGWPYGLQSVKRITSKAGKVVAEFHLNDGGTNTAQGQPDSQTVSYKSALTKPTAPERSGYEFMGWYTAENPYQTGGTTDGQWRFQGDEDANAVGEILGTDRDSYKDRIEQGSGSIRVTLYAGWRETTKPKLELALESDTSTDGSGQMTDVTGQDKYYPNLRVKLTYSDNVGVTKLYYRTSESTTATTELDMSNAVKDGSTSDNSVQYTIPFTNLNEGSRTYTFRAVDAAGNETVKTINYKLDKTLPVFGQETFTTGYKDIWHWIVRKDNFKITIPLTERGSGISK